ncbi:hypothetical protein [Aneurinibacillus uraniidurans]|uniref:hypothetical protein n=1 Tax=Aneurinibacillus uraniidurans TaxID=2966586 RepID=UPI00234B983A|nr:hypothetical protein [Aneurinibacillus sp. B1]WCN38543.1 hypothetical protein PO771_03850 [Aneurinibacillus sp. B1]
MIQHREKGAALLTVLFILILLTLLGFSLASYMMQGAKQRAIADDEVEGKMLADTGLMYLQSYMEKEAKFGADGKPLADRDVLALLDKVAKRNNPSDIKEIEAQKLTYQVTWLPQKENPHDQGGFGIAYVSLDAVGDETSDIIAAVKDPIKPSQPYVRKLRLYIVGIPARAAADNSDGQKRVLLKATAYINTIDAPFRFAVSTPGDLRLLGGSNIIGDVTAGNLVTSNQHLYSQDGVWKIDPGNSGTQSYIEGRAVFNNQTGKLYQVPSLPAAGGADKPNLDSTTKNEINDFSRSSLASHNMFTPHALPDNETVLNAKSTTPYIPGYDIPTFSRNANLKQKLSLGSIASYMAKQEADNGINSFSVTEPEIDLISGMNPGDPARYKTRPLALEVPVNDSDALEPIDIGQTTADEKLVIASDYAKDSAAIPLTIRLTGNSLKGKADRIFIGPTDSTKLATVEMGRTGSFKQTPDNSGEPFTFDGVIYIHGNLDIVGDIKIKGAIYVDGDVVIREAGNIDYDAGKKNNLAIISTGKITLTDRYLDRDNPGQVGKWTDTSTNGKASPVLSAFLYSENNLELYSHDSFNWIVGGLATSANYIELNTKREDPQDDKTGGAARLVVQFNRGIFERPTPGLPVGSSYSLDVYDVYYSPLPNELHLVF